MRRFQIKGRIVRVESKNYYVLDNNGSEIRCVLRGKFKKQLEIKKDKLYTYDFAVIGDFVEFERLPDGSGVINRISERKNYLSRKAPRIKGLMHKGERYEQIIAANINTLFLISSVDKPKFNNRLIDRILVAAESAGIETVIVINKVDLNTEKTDIKFWTNLYESIGYKVLLTSVVEKTGIETLKEYLQHKVNVFWGQSGVGKSSLLNALYPGLNFRVGEISHASQKGRHTTVTSVMKEVGEETFIIDTPGIREIEPFGISKQDLGHYFLEFVPFIHQCKFNSCTHFHEPGCAVVQAVEKGEISIERYESYLSLLTTIEDEPNY